MLSLKYARCSPILQFRRCYSTKNYKWQLLLQIRPSSPESLCKVKQVQLLSVRHFFKRKTAEGVTFKSTHKQDGISKNFKLIFYNGTTNYYMYGARCVYALAVLITGLAVPLLLKFRRQDLEFVPKKNKRAAVGKYTIGNPALFYQIGLIFIALSLVGTAMVTRNVPLRIYCDKITKEYAGRFLRFGLYKETIHFTQQDVRLVEKHSLWTGNVSICGKKSLVSEKNFQTVGDYNRFMGYDYERASDLQQEKAEENVPDMMTAGLKLHQDSKYRSFEKQYLEKRKLRNMK